MCTLLLRYWTLDIQMCVQRMSTLLFCYLKMDIHMCLCSQYILYYSDIGIWSFTCVSADNVYLLLNWCFSTCGKANYVFKTGGVSQKSKDCCISLWEIVFCKERHRQLWNVAIKVLGYTLWLPKIQNKVGVSITCLLWLHQYTCWLHCLGYRMSR